MAPPQGYDTDLGRLDEGIAEDGGARALDWPTDSARVTRYVYRLYQRASLAGDLDGLGAVDRTIGRATPLVSDAGDLFLLKARVAFDLHRLADAEAALAAVPRVRDSAEGRLMRADLDFQRGRYQAAKAGYEAGLAAERSWGALARLAYFAGKMGDPAGADRLYVEAQGELTAKEMRSFAWLEIQRGQLDFARGCADPARAHYRRAEEAYPGYWLTQEHVAELFAAEGRYGEAIEILAPLAARGARPHIAQAVGELYRLAGEAAMARRWGRQALAGYLASVRRGEVHFWHHLADYYTEVAPNGARAVAWARKDCELRPHFASQAGLAAALLCDRQLAEACECVERALASGAVDARLFLLAGQIHAATGDPLAGQSFRDRATSLNPMVERFHLHH